MPQRGSTLPVRGQLVKTSESVFLKKFCRITSAPAKIVSKPFAAPLRLQLSKLKYFPTNPQRSRDFLPPLLTIRNGVWTPERAMDKKYFNSQAEEESSGQFSEKIPEQDLPA
jgi:hypothetical protein